MSTMKVLAIISMFLACVAARGSGPYLPRGWKPDGPAFYLPSDIPKPLNVVPKEIIFSESEASGSDSLREYGPPKVQEVSQDILQQGLPDVVNEKLFIETKVDTNTAQENSNVVTDIKEQEAEVKVEVKATEETFAATESLTTTATESILYNVEEVQVKDETATLANVVGSVDAVHEFGYIVEPTEAIVVPTEKITFETNKQSANQENQGLNTDIEAQKIIQQQEFDQSARQVSESAIVTINARQSKVVVNEQAFNVESIDTSVTQQPDIGFEIISTVEEKVEKVGEELNKDENVVQNIPEIIVSLENEIKSQEVKTIQDVPVIVPEIFGSLDQAPEGFLEYGPPGFTEYGPPKEDLALNTIEEKTPETEPSEKSASRRRRFSPKLSSSPK